MKRFWGVIPARGGSKGIPKKNAKHFLGKPLVAWSVQTAVASQRFERIMVSTDDPEIAEIAREDGVETPFLRPPELATDEASTAAVIRHAIEWYVNRGSEKPDYVMVLEPTSPGRRVCDIREAVRLMTEGQVDSVASVSEVPHHFIPDKILKLDSRHLISGIDGKPVREMIHRRQDLPKYYAFNGFIFCCKVELVFQNPPTLWGERVLAYLTDTKYAVDLDRPEDWPAAEAMLKDVLLGKVKSK